jgi:hypothetical protein
MVKGARRVILQRISARPASVESAPYLPVARGVRETDSLVGSCWFARRCRRPTLTLNPAAARSAQAEHEPSPPHRAPCHSFRVRRSRLVASARTRGFGATVIEDMAKYSLNGVVRGMIASACSSPPHGRGAPRQSGPCVASPRIALAFFRAVVRSNTADRLILGDLPW